MVNSHAGNRGAEDSHILAYFGFPGPQSINRTWIGQGKCIYRVLFFLGGPEIWKCFIACPKKLYTNIYTHIGDW